MFRFMYPDAFWNLGIALFLLICFFWSRRQIQNRLESTFGLKMLPFFLAQVSQRKIKVKFWLGLMALCLIVVALARPQVGKGKSQIKSEGVEVMVAIDVSNSMLAEDVKPSRLEHAKKEVLRLMGMMGGHKVGLLGFAGSAVLLSPLTNDKSALRMFLETLSPESVETQGTELRKALAEAQDAFDRGGDEANPEKRVTRVIVLISDGEDHEEGAIKFAKDLAEKGTRVFTMAFGSERGGKVPKRDARGLLRGYMKDESGQEVMSKVNGETLKQIARAGKGSFYHVTFGGDHMKRLLEDLNKLEKAEFDTLSSESFGERYQIPLFFAFFFGLFDVLLGTRKKRDPKWKGRFVSGESQ